MKTTTFERIVKTLGPGILFASTAIGVSHLVQSTRAGAQYGFSLVGLIIMANVLKYPFFEFGSRYANATGSSLIDGYFRISKWILWLYFFITLSSMFFVTAAVGAVTSGFLDNLFKINTLSDNSFQITTVFLFFICFFILYTGKYNLLDKMIKIIGAALLITTVIAFTLTVIHGPQHTSALFPPVNFNDTSTIAFIIALMGWMPTAVDLSTWNSLWTVERIKQTDFRPSLRETLAEFNFGYWVSALLSLCFVTMGAFLVFGSQETMPDKSHLFANKVVELYTATIGKWSYPLIAASAFSIMFGTAIAVFDGYARAMERTCKLLLLSPEKSTESLNNNTIYRIVLVILCIGSLVIILQFGKSLKKLVDLATTISFLIAPVVAVINYRLVSKKYIHPNYVPGKIMHVLSWLGIIFLTGFSVFYLLSL
ncbi:MAG: divalent metal cation transporter [Bacteroidetes bacterium]|nr:MAG: divalent metal cation transporter [Bacteroidota bacterium]